MLCPSCDKERAHCLLAEVGSCDEDVWRKWEGTLRSEVAVIVFLPCYSLQRVMPIHATTNPPGSRLRYRTHNHRLRLIGLVILFVLMAALTATLAIAQAAQFPASSPAVRADLLPPHLRDQPLRKHLRAVLAEVRQLGSAATKSAPAASLQDINAAPTNETILAAAGSVPGDQVGWSVSIDGDRALVGALGDSEQGVFAGAAYVFAFNGATWTQEAKLTASDGADFDFFGWSVSLDGNRALIGAFGDDVEKGAAYVFAFDGATWTQEAKLTATGGAVFDDFGISVSLDGDQALIGAFGDATNGAFAGAAYIFAFDGASWSQQAKLFSTDISAGDDLGVSVSLSGDRALVGADGEDDKGMAAGAAYVFAFDGATWSQQAKLTASDGAEFDFFGQAVSLEGDRALLGAPLDDDVGSASGSAYVFMASGSVWSQQAKLTASDGAMFDDFGTSVSLDGSQAIVGSVGDDDLGSTSGAAYVFTLDAMVWGQQAKLTASDGAADDFYGLSVSASDGQFLVGSPGHEGATGAAYVYAADAPPPLPHPYLFLAEEKILLDGQNVSVGDMHSNGEIEIKKGQPSTHFGDLTAVDKIKIDKNNTIDGDVTSGDEVELKGNATVTGTVTEDADVDPLPLPDLSFSAGGPEIFVDKNQTLALAPGTYGDLKVEVNATLILSSGDYFFTQAEFKKEAVLSVDVSGGPVTINVVNDVKFEKETEVDIVPLGDAGSTLVRINTLDDVTIKKEARILGTIVAPEGKVLVDKEGFFKGLICAKEIEVKKEGTLLFHGASIPSAQASVQAAPPAPLAQAEAATSQAVPEGYRLAPNYPNPFNPITTIAFDVPETVSVRVVVYDVTGRLVARLVDRPMVAGRHEVRFDASALPSGVYLYQVQAGHFTEIRRMVLVK